MKLEWNKRYTTIAAYAFLVAAAIILFYALVANFGAFKMRLAAVLSPLAPFGYGFVLAYVLNPVLKWTEAKLLGRIRSVKLRRYLGIGLTYLFAVVFLAIFFWVVIPQIIISLTGLANNLPYYVTSVSGWIDSLVALLPNAQIPEKLATVVTETLDGLYALLQSLVPVVLSSISRLTSGVIQFIVGIIVSLYMLKSKERFFAQSKKMLTAFLPEKAVNSIINITRDGNKKFSGFISGKILDSTIIGIICFGGMSVFGMPYALLCSVIVGITNIIPYFGPFIGAIPCFLIILTANPIKAIWFCLFILVLQQVDGNIIGPRILGDTTGLSAFWVIFSILLFGGSMGFLGMLIGVPLFALFYSVVRGLIQYRLWKKGQPLDTEDYASDKHKLID